MIIKESPPTKPWEEISNDLNPKEMKLLEEKFLQRFTNSVISQLVRFENISHISTNPLIILKGTLDPFAEKNAASSILGFDLKTIDPKNATEERKVAANFLIEGIKNTLTKILDDKKMLANTEIPILENFKIFQSTNTNSDAINKIEKILCDHWLGYNSNPDDLNPKLAEIKRILRFMKENPKLSVSKMARELRISTTKLNSIKNENLLDKNGNVAPRIEKSTSKLEFIAGQSGRQVHINSVLRVLRCLKDYPGEKNPLEIAKIAGLSPKVTSYCMENFKLDENGKVVPKTNNPKSID